MLRYCFCCQSAHVKRSSCLTYLVHGITGGICNNTYKACSQQSAVGACRRCDKQAAHVKVCMLISLTGQAHEPSASLQATHKRVQSIRADGELRRTNSSDNMADGSPRILARQAMCDQLDTIPCMALCVGRLSHLQQHPAKSAAC